MQIAIIGGGAAGFFAAIAVKDNHPNAHVVILEKTKKILTKVKVSGGGRCNVTNGEAVVSKLVKAYPRGGRLLKKAFYEFNNQDAMAWFKKRGVPLVIQEDNCVFPKSQDSQSIIDCFLGQCKKKGIVIKTMSKVVSLAQKGEKVLITFGNDQTRVYDKVIITTGGSPRAKGLVWLQKLGHKISPPVPSLFTFNMPKENVKKLMGVVVNATAHIAGTKLKADGPLLITHWGMSGPAILKLSAFGARVLADKDYQFEVRINWTLDKNNAQVQELLSRIIRENGAKLLINFRPLKLPERLWYHLIEKANISRDRKWNELGSKSINRIVEVLCNDSYKVSGKTTFKEEFVTCGGISLDSIHHKTMQSKHIKNLYFAGEIMDIDGITGGYNFQAAWTTGFVAGKLG